MSRSEKSRCRSIGKNWHIATFAGKGNSIGACAYSEFWERWLPIRQMKRCRDRYRKRRPACPAVVCSGREPDRPASGTRAVPKRRKAANPASAISATGLAYRPADPVASRGPASKASVSTRFRASIEVLPERPRRPARPSFSVETMSDTAARLWARRHSLRSRAECGFENADLLIREGLHDHDEYGRPSR